MKLHIYDLPAPQQYNEIVEERTVAHYGMNGVISRDTSTDPTKVISRVQIGWEGLTVLERDAIFSAYSYMMTYFPVQYIDPIGGTHSAQLPAKERVFRYTAYDSVKENGVISAQFDITLVLEVF